MNVFSLEEDEKAKEHNAKKPVAIMFLLHGSMSKADHVELVAKAILGEVYQYRKASEDRGEKEELDLWVVTFVSVLQPRFIVRKGSGQGELLKDTRDRTTGTTVLGWWTARRIRLGAKH